MLCSNSSCLYGGCEVLQSIVCKLEAQETDVISTQVSENQSIQWCDNIAIRAKTVHLFDKLMSSDNSSPLVYGNRQEKWSLHILNDRTAVFINSSFYPRILLVVTALWLTCAQSSQPGFLNFLGFFTSPFLNMGFHVGFQMFISEIITVTTSMTGFKKKDKR